MRLIWESVLDYFHKTTQIEILLFPNLLINREGDHLHR
jgi:hypothetical protein